MTTVPTFLVRDDTIVEVAYTEWEETHPGIWELTGKTVVNIDDDTDRVIFELPGGCFQIEKNLGPGKVTFMSGLPTSVVTRCTQKAHYPNDIKQTEPMVVSTNI